MAKRMLADVLWNAANDHLSVPHTYGDAMYSCCAVGCASEAAGLDYRAAFPFLTELGCRCDSYCEASIRLALWCLDDSKAPGWMHIERETP
jgi:hypothetical protein